jgi:heptaprenyl diphosphate synthase
MKDVRRLVIIALLSGLAVVIYAVESFIPTPSPWLRLGFSHIITLFALLFFGTSTAFMVFCIRTFVGSLIIGKLFSPTFILGFVGGAAALAVMAVMLDLFRGRWFSVVGISVAGAWINNIVQVVLAYLVFIRHPDIFLILPAFGLFALGTGIVNGIAVYYLQRYAVAALGLKPRFAVWNDLNSPDEGRPQGAR